MTIAELIDNIYIAYENQFDYIWKYCESLKISKDDIENNVQKDDQCIECVAWRI